MTDAILNREAALVPMSENDPTAQINRQSSLVPHTLPASAITAICNRACAYVIVTRPHDWGLFDDPAL